MHHGFPPPSADVSEDHGGCFRWPDRRARASSSAPASFRCSFADAKKMLHLRNAETGEICPLTFLSSVEKANHFPTP
jgi:hypothetical protein